MKRRLFRVTRLYLCLCLCLWTSVIFLVSFNIRSLPFLPESSPATRYSTTNTSTTATTSSSLPQRTTSPPGSNSTKLLCVKFVGRLGNEMFQYASTLGLSLTLHRQPVFLDAVHLPKVLKHYMGVPAASKAVLEARCKNATVVSEESCCKFLANMTELDPQRDYTVEKYLQSYRYFERHEDAIRRALTFADAIRNESSRVVADLRARYNASVLVGVHVRRGDLTKEHNRKLGYPLPSPAYLNRSMAFLQARHPRCVFVVGSDDMQWCRDNLPSGYHVHFLTPRSAAVDLLTLSSLDHAVLTFGTFSWWVGFLGPGSTLYMKDFIVNGSYVGNTFHPQGRDYVYPGWIPM